LLEFSEEAFVADLLSIGSSGLFAAKKGLQTSGHNLSNANTEGYSRQRIKQTTNLPTSQQGLIIGTGTKVDNVNRIHDPFVEKRMQQTLSRFTYFKERSEQLGQVENIFNEIENDGLNKMITKFFNSFRELSAQPENETIRSVVRDNATLIIKDFKRINETLEKMSHTIDQRLKAKTIDLNQGLVHIANLNRKITELEATGAETGDLRDQRDLAVKNLSETFELQTYTDEKNQFVISAKGVGTLVAGAEIQEVSSGSIPKETKFGQEVNQVHLFYKRRPTFAISPKMQNGEVGSMLEVRDSDIKELQHNIDIIAYNVTQLVNAVHRRGVVARELPVDPNGRVPASDNKGLTTGINFFKELDSMHGAAANIDLSDDIKNDLSNITTGLAPNSPGDNRVALAISKIQHEKVLNDESTTVEEYYLQMIGKLGLEAGKANLDMEQSKGILAQLTSLKERVSGVSIDEETSNMVRYQHAYDASARVMKVADEMFETVLGILKR